MKILGDVISPFVRACLVTAHEVGLKDKVSLVATSVKPMTSNVDLTKLSAIGKIPVLVTDHAHPVHDSRHQRGNAACTRLIHPTTQVEQVLDSFPIAAQHRSENVIVFRRN